MPIKLLDAAFGIRLTGIVLLLISMSFGHEAYADTLSLPVMSSSAESGKEGAVSLLMQDDKLALQMRNLAEQLATDKNVSANLDSRLKLQTLLGQFDLALATLDSLKKRHSMANGHPGLFDYMHYELYLKAKRLQQANTIEFGAAIDTVFSDAFGHLSNRQAAMASYYSSWNLEQGESYIRWLLTPEQPGDGLTSQRAMRLLAEYQDYIVYSSIVPLTELALADDNGRRYLIDDPVLIKTSDGATLSAIVVRPKNLTGRKPTALMFTIYADNGNNLHQAIEAASYGYISVIALARGKQMSPDPVEPYEHETNDVNDIIDWISKQAWSDGRVVMYGGSYSGFAQWAACKKPHPALKTIVPYVAAIPGLGVPMENNIFLTANYAWPFYVADNKGLDNAIYFDNKRWDELKEHWYQSGRAFRDIDKVDGKDNPWLQKWLSHPLYDHYWQQMVPYQQDYENINIPVLSITGYYDDGQISALHYLNEHYRYNKKANHYLLIGPYDHFGAQAQPAAVLRGYKIDPVAQINMTDITFQWFDYVLKGGKKPSLLKARINFELMGDNSWQHVPSLQAMNARSKKLYLSRKTSGVFHVLTSAPEKTPGSLIQQVDFADRTTSQNDYYPWPIIKEHIDLSSGLAFVSDTFTHDVAMNGQFSGELKIRTNKKDVDLGVVLYELTADGRAFHLSYFLARASSARDLSSRQLLVPGQIVAVPIARSRMVAKRIAKGSRLLVVVNVNKNPYAQINYGSGKDVSDETIADATEPLKIEWFSDSFIAVPTSPIE